MSKIYATMEMKIWNRLCEKVNKKINVSEGRFEKEIVVEDYWPEKFEESKI